MLSDEFIALHPHIRICGVMGMASLTDDETKIRAEFKAIKATFERLKDEVFDGCDYFCTYCTVPIARGKSRNASVALTVEEAKKAAAEAAAKAAEIPEKPEGCALIGIEDFMNVELRTAKIIACEGVPKAKKLLKLQVDLGYEQRQVVSGIAKYYTPDQLIGKKIILVANLAPAKLCGVESNGMILASGEEDVRVVFLHPDTRLGERVR